MLIRIELIATEPVDDEEIPEQLVDQATKSIIEASKDKDSR